MHSYSMPARTAALTFDDRPSPTAGQRMDRLRLPALRERSRSNDHSVLAAVRPGPRAAGRVARAWARPGRKV